MIATALLQSRTFALVAVAALGARIATHLIRSIVAYRRVMRRPWPAVAPVLDDD